MSEFNPDPPRDIKLIAEIRKHKRAIKESYNFHKMDELYGSLPVEIVEFLHECGKTDEDLYDRAEEIINE